MDAVSSDDGNQSGRPTWRVEGLRRVHQRDRRRNREGRREPELRGEDGEERDPDQSGQYMASEQISRLGERAAHRPIDQNCRRAKGADDHHQARSIQKLVVDDRDKRNSEERADPGQSDLTGPVGSWA